LLLGECLSELLKVESRGWSTASAMPWSTGFALDGEKTRLTAEASAVRNKIGSSRREAILDRMVVKIVLVGDERRKFEFGFLLFR
jgi:hypothetical protein